MWPGSGRRKCRIVVLTTDPSLLASGAAARSAAWRPSHGFRRFSASGRAWASGRDFLPNFAGTGLLAVLRPISKKSAAWGPGSSRSVRSVLSTPFPVPARLRSRPGPAGLERSAQRMREELVLGVSAGLIVRAFTPVPGPVGLRTLVPGRRSTGWWKAAPVPGRCVHP